jgi:hypothetical protein
MAAIASGPCGVVCERHTVRKARQGKRERRTLGAVAVVAAVLGDGGAVALGACDAQHHDGPVGRAHGDGVLPVSSVLGRHRQLCAHPHMRM